MAKAKSVFKGFYESETSAACAAAAQAVHYTDTFGRVGFSRDCVGPLEDF
jgi:hypothetical protein